MSGGWEGYLTVPSGFSRSCCARVSCSLRCLCLVLMLDIMIVSCGFLRSENRSVTRTYPSILTTLRNLCGVSHLYDRILCHISSRFFMSLWVTSSGDPTPSRKLTLHLPGRAEQLPISLLRLSMKKAPTIFSPLESIVLYAAEMHGVLESTLRISHLNTVDARGT